MQLRNFVGAAFVVYVSAFGGASADPQAPTLKGTYVLNETAYCGQVLGNQYIGTYDFDPDSGLLTERVTFVHQTIKNGKAKLEYEKISDAPVSYTLKDGSLRIAGHKIPSKIEFGSVVNGVALYASFIDFNQATKELNACQSMGTLVHQ